MKLRRFLYRGASLLGWIEAIVSGKPSRVVKRMFNVLLGRKVVRRLWWR